MDIFLYGMEIQWIQRFCGRISHWRANWGQFKDFFVNFFFLVLWKHFVLLLAVCITVILLNNFCFVTEITESILEAQMCDSKFCMYENYYSLIGRWKSVADLGFPKGGGVNPREERKPIIWPIFFRKLHENE